jgi:hypothetical protein
MMRRLLAGHHLQVLFLRRRVALGRLGPDLGACTSQLAGLASNGMPIPLGPRQVHCALPLRPGAELAGRRIAGEQRRRLEAQLCLLLLRLPPEAANEGHASIVGSHEDELVRWHWHRRMATKKCGANAGCCEAAPLANRKG